MHNLPSLRKFAEDQGEQALRLFSIGHGRDEIRRERRPRRDTAFRCASSRIPVCPSRVPRPDTPSCNDRARLASPSIRGRPEKNVRLRRIPVSGHEGFEIFPVPGCLLVVNHFANRRAVGSPASWALLATAKAATMPIRRSKSRMGTSEGFRLHHIGFLQGGEIAEGKMLRMIRFNQRLREDANCRDCGIVEAMP